MPFLLILRIFGTLIPYIFMALGQSVIENQTAFLIYILEPVFAMLISFIFFNEEPLYYKIIGGIIILIAQIVALKRIRFIKNS